MVKKGKKKTKATKSGKKGPAKVSAKEKVKQWKNSHPHLFVELNKNYAVGNDVQPKRDLSRMVKWPRYIRLQRQRKILTQRLKIPPAINQFTKTIDKNSASVLFKLLFSYRPETKKEKKERLKKQAEAETKGEEAPKTKKKPVVKFGFNHVTHLIEKKEAKLVIIAHDVLPIELVLWMPALCRKMGVPYCIVKGKARLGQVVHLKNAACLALTQVRKEDQHTLDALISSYVALFNDCYAQDKRKWGGGKLGFKARAQLRLKERERQKELKKMGHLLP